RARIRPEVGERIDARAYPARLDERQPELRAELRRLFAVELEHRRMHTADDLRNLRGIGVDEQGHRLHEWRQCIAELDRTLERQIARAGRIKYQADSIGARLRRRLRILHARDAADLY